MIDAGAELEALDRKCQTPLFSAVFNHRKEVAQLLLENGADPEGSSKNLNTPLDIAIMHKDVEMLKVLSIKCGNEISMPDKYYYYLNNLFFICMFSLLNQHIFSIYHLFLMAVYFLAKIVRNLLKSF